MSINTSVIPNKNISTDVATTTANITPIITMSFKRRLDNRLKDAPGLEATTSVRQVHRKPTTHIKISFFSHSNSQVLTHK